MYKRQAELAASYVDRARTLGCADAAIESAVIARLHSGVDPAAWESIRRTRVMLKAPITTPAGGGVIAPTRGAPEIVDAARAVGLAVIRAAALAGGISVAAEERRRSQAAGQASGERHQRYDGETCVHAPPATARGPRS